MSDRDKQGYDAAKKLADHVNSNGYLTERLRMNSFMIPSHVIAERNEAADAIEQLTAETEHLADVAQVHIDVTEIQRERIANLEAEKAERIAKMEAEKADIVNAYHAREMDYIKRIGELEAEIERQKNINSTLLSEHQGMFAKINELENELRPLKNHRDDLLIECNKHIDEIERLGASLLISQEKHKLAIKEMERQRDLLEALSADRLGDTAALRRMTTAFESMEQTCKDMQNPAKRSGPTHEPQVLQVQKEQEFSE